MEIGDQRHYLRWIIVVLVYYYIYSDMITSHYFSQCIFFFGSITLPNDKLLNWSKLKAFADKKRSVTHKLKFALGRVENSMRKGENAGYTSIFHNVFKRILSQGH